MVVTRRNVFICIKDAMRKSLNRLPHCFFYGKTYLYIMGIDFYERRLD